MAKKYKLAAFDVDGTMIDTEIVCVKSLSKTVLELLGKEISDEESASYFGMPSCEVARLFNYADEDGFGHRWEENFIELNYLIKPFPGVKETLAEVKRRGYLTCVVTSRNRMEFEYDKHLAELLEHFDNNVVAEDTIQHKPSSEPMEKAIEKISRQFGIELDPSECIYFGDTLHDSSCAKGAGCDFALADWKKRGGNGIPADYIFNDGAGVLDILA